MVSTEEIKEDFFYIVLIETGILLAGAANTIYSGDFKTCLVYFMVFYAVFILENQVKKMLLISKNRDIVKKYRTILNEKKMTKRKIVILTVSLILLSSWGIVNYISNIYSGITEYLHVLIIFIPWYITIYGVYLGVLIYKKEKCVKMIYSLITKKREKEEIKHIVLLHGNTLIVRISKTENGVENEFIEEIAKHSEDFRYMGMNVAIIRMEKMKLAVAHTGKISTLTRSKMIDTLKSIKISYPKEFQRGEFKKGTRMEIEKIIRKHLLS